MQVNIRYMGSAADSAGCNQEQMELQEGMTIGEFTTALESKYQGLGNIQYKIAQNQEFVSVDDLINSNAELAILPPFAGG